MPEEKTPAKDDDVSVRVVAVDGPIARCANGMWKYFKPASAAAAFLASMAANPLDHPLSSLHRQREPRGSATK